MQISWLFFFPENTVLYTESMSGWIMHFNVKDIHVFTLSSGKDRPELAV